MTYNYSTPELISQYMSVSIDHILLKLQQLLIHHLTASHLLFIYLFIILLLLSIYVLLVASFATSVYNMLNIPTL